MAKLIIPPGFAHLKARYLCTGDNEEMVWTLGVDVHSATDPLLIAQRFYNAVDNSVSGAPEMYPPWFFVGTTCTLGNDGEPLYAQYDFSRAGTRTAAGTPPNNCAVLVRKNTSFGGRRNRGRAFFPPCSLAETAVDNVGNITPSVVTGIQSNWTELYTDLTTNVTLPLSPVILHSDQPATPTPVTGFVVQSRIATQRTRMRR